MSNVNTSQTELTFRGLDADDCTWFIREVHKRAHEAGRLRDNSWMADIAMIAFDGDALEWFDEQTPETQADWMLLRRALLQKYSRNCFVPTPPAAIRLPTSMATAVAPTLNPSTRLNPADSSPMLFRIQVMAPKAGYQGYVSQTFEDTNFGRCCTLTENPAEAIEVKPSGDYKRFILHTPDFSGNWQIGKRIAAHHTRKSPWCAILSLWLPVPPSAQPQYLHHSANGNEKTDDAFIFWNVGESGKLSLHNPSGYKTVIAKTVDGGLTITFWEHRVWENDDDAYVADLYLVRPV